MRKTLLIVILGLCGCSSQKPPGTTGPDSQPDGAVAIPADLERGRQSYAQLCASCHGADATGAMAMPLPLVPWTRTTDQLITRIDQTMPLGAPDLCDLACAQDIAVFLLSLRPDDKPLVCDDRPLAPRQLRLLNRREYANTVRDLFAVPPASCTTNATCAIKTESCVAGLCQPDACGVATFLWRANGAMPASVHVAGPFNAWSPTPIPEWTMARLGDAFVLKRPLPLATYPYKFVVDGKWLVDADNPARQPDGVGGENSVLVHKCGEPPGLAPAGPSQNFPLESRPKGYAFDNNGPAGLVTTTHVEQYLDAAVALAASAPAVAGCQPAADPRPCAEQFVKAFGLRAFRRPLETEEVARYSGALLAQADFNTGLKQVAAMMLSSPHFLYRSELGVLQTDGTYRLTAYEVASALSYSLWATLPDAALLEAAAQGKLGTTAEVEAQARRMLLDPRARQMVRTFGLQWLGVEQVLTVDKNAQQFPTFTPDVRAAMADETRRFVEHVVFDGTGRFDELFTADYSFVAPVLSPIYGLPADPAPKRKLPADRAAGVLAHGSVLASYAYSNQSSPVRRGLFVRRNLLCQEFNPPPANAGGVPAVNPNATTRERFAQHSSDPLCSSCHRYIDDVGFGFEAFDAIGSIRTTDNGRPIDNAGLLTDVERFGAGTASPFSTLPQLSKLLVESQSAKSCFATHVFRYTRGYLESKAERCTIAGLDEGFTSSGGDIRELLVRSLSDSHFLNRHLEGAGP